MNTDDSITHTHTHIFLQAAKEIHAWKMEK